MANFQSGTPQQQSKSSPGPESLFYEFSAEETNVMKECNRESFFQRSLPLSLIFGTGSYFGVSAGYLKPNAKWGPWPKVLVGGMIGYIIGKYSYQAICAEKLMQMPNSQIGRVLREQRGKLKGGFNEGSVMSPVITKGTEGTESQSFTTDYKSNIDIDTHKSVNLLDTDYRPDYDELGSSKQTTEYQLPSYNANESISYDELRARNRQEYERTQPNKPIYRSPTPPNSQPIWDNQSYPPPEQTRNNTKPLSRNQYGDVFNN